jgi:hypothetical protein
MPQQPSYQVGSVGTAPTLEPVYDPSLGMNYPDPIQRSPVMPLPTAPIMDMRVPMPSQPPPAGNVQSGTLQPQPDMSTNMNDYTPMGMGQVMPAGYQPTLEPGYDPSLGIQNYPYLIQPSEMPLPTAPSPIMDMMTPVVGHQVGAPPSWRDARADYRDQRQQWRDSRPDFSQLFGRDRRTAMQDWRSQRPDPSGWKDMRSEFLSQLARRGRSRRPYGMR